MIAGEVLRFDTAVTLDELMEMSLAEIDYLDSLYPEEAASWLNLWRSVREVAV